MKEIGGYFQMEPLPGKEYHQNLLRLNLGRTALLYALQELKVQILYLPRFICDSVTAICETWDGTVKWYPLAEDFLPARDFEPEAGSFVYVINYYGQLTMDKILYLKDKYENLIVDHTHDFYQKPVEGVPTLYSCRKFFGLPDGAYLYLPQKPFDYEKLPLDSSAARMSHILGRYEHSASDYYQNMLDTAESFYQEPVKQMSPLTRNLLSGIDYESAAMRRQTNYRILEEHLGNFNGKKFSTPQVPFVYPFYTNKAAILKKSLAAQKIFVPTYWNNVIAQCSSDCLEWDFASHILPLPVDQRYLPADMELLARVLLEQLQETGGSL